MIEDVARLGYLDGVVFDATYGEGTFWREWKPDMLVTNDLYKPADHHCDFRQMPFEDDAFDVVVFDPDYKLTGTPASGNKDFIYGTDRAKRWQERMGDIVCGAVECARVARSCLLVKCMDQVVSGRMVWQTDEITRAVSGVKIDRFDLLNAPQPQPPGRRQVHARANYSTLLVFDVG
jgi:hypothetical protein